MSFFKKKPVYTPQTGAVSLDRNQFKTMMRTRPIFREYSRNVGLQPAATAIDNAYTENLRCMGAGGFWQFGTSANVGNPTVLRFPDDAGLATFFTAIEGLMDFDIKKMDQRAAYANGLKGKAGNGLLYTGLLANTEPEANYYQAPVPAAPKPGAPAIPAKPANLVNQAKGLAWLSHGVHGDTTAFTRMLMRHSKFDGTFPLGTDASLLMGVWQALVPIAPTYRGWTNMAMQQKYPSNVGGVKVLNEIIGDLSTSAMPAAGDNRWYDLALYVLGSIVTTQAFTDGNKRMSRFAYVLMLLSGGVPIVVPNGTYGSSLGDML